MFMEACERYKEKVAFVYRVGEQEFEVTYQKFFDDVLLLSRELKAKKITKNSKVMFL